MAKILETVLLFALPASGKSEVRKYLELLDPTVAASEFHLGSTVQLDDFPYVHLMRRVAETLGELGEDRIFFPSMERPFTDPRDWGTLIELLNEDHADLLAKRVHEPESAGAWLLDRLDAARDKVGAPAQLGALDAGVRAKVVTAIEDEARQLARDLAAQHPETLDGKTIVLEAARGGAEGSSLPLEPPFGYRYSLGRLSPELLEHATILYIWVTPEESRRKNDARADPNDPGSILHHGVPLEVMLGDYGCDDMGWLIEQSEKPGCIQIEAHGRTYDIPVARFDNRVDKTSFVREDPADWNPADVTALHEGLRKALGELAAATA
jgi:hypothetical protein